MGGILGIYFTNKSKRVSIELVVDSTDKMNQRGPDDRGVYVNGNIGLGHRRLSNIDLSYGHPEYGILVSPKDVDNLRDGLLSCIKKVGKRIF